MGEDPRISNRQPLELAPLHPQVLQQELLDLAQRPVVAVPGDDGGRTIEAKPLRTECHRSVLQVQLTGACRRVVTQELRRLHHTSDVLHPAERLRRRRLLALGLSPRLVARVLLGHSPIQLLLGRQSNQHLPRSGIGVRPQLLLKTIDELVRLALLTRLESAIALRVEAALLHGRNREVVQAALELGVPPRPHPRPAAVGRLEPSIGPKVRNPRKQSDFADDGDQLPGEAPRHTANVVGEPLGDGHFLHEALQDLEEVTLHLLFTGSRKRSSSASRSLSEY